MKIMNQKYAMKTGKPEFVCPGDVASAEVNWDMVNPLLICADGSPRDNVNAIADELLTPPYAVLAKKLMCDQAFIVDELEENWDVVVVSAVCSGATTPQQVFDIAV